jgi:hypothetical protein
LEQVYFDAGVDQLFDTLETMHTQGQVSTQDVLSFVPADVQERVRRETELAK